MSKIEIITSDEDAPTAAYGTTSVAGTQPPLTRVGHGFVAAPLEAVIGPSPQWILSDIAHGTMPSGLSPAVLKQNGRIWSLKFGEGVTVRTRAPVMLDDEDALLVDTRKAGAQLEVLAGAQRYLLLLDDVLNVHLPASPSSDFTSALTSARRSSDQIVPRPVLSDLSGGEPLEDWLIRAFERLAGSPSSLARISASGLVARGWIPRDGAALRRSFAAVMRGEGTPTTRALDWCRALPVEQRHAAAAELVTSLPAFLDELRDLQAMITEGVEAGTVALALLLRRDDLQSAAFLLAGDKEVGAGIHEALAHLDRAAFVHSALWSEVRLGDDPRLATIRLSEPDAWWARL